MKKTICLLVGLAAFQLTQAQNIEAASATPFAGNIYHTGGFLGIGTTSPLTNFQIADRFHIQSSGSGYNLMNNAYHNGTSYVRTVTGTATQFTSTGSGDIYIRPAVSGTAGSPITWNTGIYIRNDGRVTIGTITSTDLSNAPDYQLYVQKGIITEKVKVAIKGSGDWSDFVFDKGYRLRPLEELKSYVDAHHHLPDVPSAEEVVKNGIDIAQMDARLLQKIEELTLYMFELKKENDELREMIQQKQQ